MKRWLALALAALLCLALPACGSSKTSFDRTSGTDTSTDTSGLKIAYSTIADGSEAPWSGVLWDKMAQVCQENGWTLDAQSANGVPAAQAQQIEQLLANDPDYFILFAGDVNMADQWVKDIHNAGIPVITLVVDATANALNEVSAYVGPDQEALAAQLARDMIAANGASAALNVVAISGWEFQQDYILRQQGYEKTLNYYSNYNLLATQYAGASREEARSIMETYLNDYGTDGIDAVMCYDAEFAMGALEAIQAAGLEKEIQIYSITGSSEIYDAVQNGLITEVAAFSSDALVQRCADVIAGLEAGTIPDHYNYIDRIYITSDNVKDYADSGEY